MATERQLVPDRHSAKRNRLEVRLERAQKERVQHAADIQGRSLSDFVNESVQRAAANVIRDYETTTLRAEASRAFVETMMNPPEPTERQILGAQHLLRELQG